jgi:HSP20 family protein
LESRKEQHAAVKYVVTRGLHRDSVRVQQEMEEMFRSLLPARPAVDPRRNGLWRPPIEVYETTDALVVTAEIAGLDRDLLRITIDGDMLQLRGERPDPKQAEKRSYHEARIPYGQFGADVFVPFPVDADSANADYENGFLRIVLPRLKPRTIVPGNGNRPEGQGATS